MTAFGTATLAVAIPDDSPDVTVEQAAQQCNADQTIACCNSGDDSLIGANCVTVPIIAIPIQSACTDSQQPACCQNGDVDQTGLINLNAECTPINLGL